MSKAIQKMETIQAIDRAFQILETISRSGNMTLAELHEKMNISKASLSRLVYTLVENGYIEKRPNNEYSLTLKAVSYTHLDVYKRQTSPSISDREWYALWPKISSLPGFTRYR